MKKQAPSKTSSAFKPLIASSLALALGVSVASAQCQITDEKPTADCTAADADKSGMWHGADLNNMTEASMSENATGASLKEFGWGITGNDLKPTNGVSASPTNYTDLDFKFGTGAGVDGSKDSNIAGQYNITIGSSNKAFILNAGDSKTLQSNLSINFQDSQDPNFTYYLNAKALDGKLTLQKAGIFEATLVDGITGQINNDGADATITLTGTTIPAGGTHGELVTKGGGTTTLTAGSATAISFKATGSHKSFSATGGGQNIVTANPADLTLAGGIIAGGKDKPSAGTNTIEAKSLTLTNGNITVGGKSDDEFARNIITTTGNITLTATDTTDKKGYGDIVAYTFGENNITTKNGGNLTLKGSIVAGSGDENKKDKNAKNILNIDGKITLDGTPQVGVTIGAILAQNGGGNDIKAKEIEISSELIANTGGNNIITIVDDQNSQTNQVFVINGTPDKKSITARSGGSNTINAGVADLTLAGGILAGLRGTSTDDTPSTTNEQGKNTITAKSLTLETNDIAVAGTKESNSLNRITAIGDGNVQTPIGTITLETGSIQSYFFGKNEIKAKSLTLAKGVISAGDKQNGDKSDAVNDIDLLNALTLKGTGDEKGGHIIASNGGTNIIKAGAIDTAGNISANGGTNAITLTGALTFNGAVGQFAGNIISSKGGENIITADSLTLTGNLSADGGNNTLTLKGATVTNSSIAGNIIANGGTNMLNVEGGRTLEIGKTKIITITSDVDNSANIFNVAKNAKLVIGAPAQVANIVTTKGKNEFILAKTEGSNTENLNITGNFTNNGGTLYIGGASNTPAGNVTITSENDLVVNEANAKNEINVESGTLKFASILAGAEGAINSIAIAGDNGGTQSTIALGKTSTNHSIWAQAKGKNTIDAKTAKLTTGGKIMAGLKGATEDASQTGTNTITVKSLTIADGGIAVAGVEGENGKSQNTINVTDTITLTAGDIQSYFFGTNEITAGSLELTAGNIAAGETEKKPNGDPNPHAKKGGALNQIKVDALNLVKGGIYAYFNDAQNIITAGSIKAKAVSAEKALNKLTIKGTGTDIGLVVARNGGKNEITFETGDNKITNQIIVGAENQDDENAINTFNINDGTLTYASTNNLTASNKGQNIFNVADGAKLVLGNSSNQATILANKTGGGTYGGTNAFILREQGSLKVEGNFNNDGGILYIGGKNDQNKSIAAGNLEVISTSNLYANVDGAKNMINVKQLTMKVANIVSGNGGSNTITVQDGTITGNIIANDGGNNTFNVNGGMLSIGGSATGANTFNVNGGSLKFANIENVDGKNIIKLGGDNGVLVISGKNQTINSNLIFAEGTGIVSLKDVQEFGTLTINKIAKEKEANAVFVSKLQKNEQANGYDADKITVKGLVDEQEEAGKTYHIGLVSANGKKPDISEIEYDADNTKKNIAIAIVKVKAGATNQGDIKDQGIVKFEGASELKGFEITRPDFVAKFSDEGGVEMERGEYVTYYLKNFKTQVHAGTQELLSSLAFSTTDLYLSNFNSLNKRMGDLRNNNNAHGVWGRVFAGAQSNDFGLRSKSNFVTAQGGYDYAFGFEGASNYLGLALSYSHSASNFKDKVSHKASDTMIFDLGIDGFSSDLVEVALYNSYVQDSGWYNDSIFKFSYGMNSVDVRSEKRDIPNTLQTQTADINSYAITFSNEAGYRFRVGDKKQWFIDPQVELGMGYVMGRDFDFKDLDGATLNASIDNLLLVRTRVGASIGFDSKYYAPESDTSVSVYTGAFYEADYYNGGNTNFAVPNQAQMTADNLIKTDGRVVINVGADMQIKDTRLYVDFETSFLGKVRTDYKFNVGARYSFGEKLNYTDLNNIKPATPLKLKEDKAEDKADDTSTEE